MDKKIFKLCFGALATLGFSAIHTIIKLESIQNVRTKVGFYFRMRNTKSMTYPFKRT